MVKFVELNEAAKQLGVTPDELVEMRSAGEIHGYRDGTSWKFKHEEVERVLAERTGGGDLADDNDDESVLVSEEALGHSGESTSSTVIGKQDDAGDADSDLSLSESGSDLSMASDSASEIDLSPAETPADGGSSIDGDVTLVPGVGGGSDVSLVPDPGSDKEISPDAGTDLQLGEASSGALSGDLEGLDDELALSDDDDLVLSSGSDSGSDLSLSSADSGIDLSSPSDSGLSLEADSGISLQSPTDSGLSLEDDAVDASGSSISSLELPEDDEVALDDAGGEPVQQDEQFMLSPSDEMFTDESDSGSQVIALEDSESFDQGMGDDGLDDGLGGQLDGLDAGPTAPVMAPASRGGEVAEADYSVWNIMGLVLVMLFLMLTGILLMDVLGNMWAWEEGRDASTSIAEGITNALGL